LSHSFAVQLPAAAARKRTKPSSKLDDVAKRGRIS
jgi:hypothetical protein